MHDISAETVPFITLGKHRHSIVLFADTSAKPVLTPCFAYVLGDPLGIGGLDCLSPGPPDCSDNLACTDDFCDQQAQSCAHVPNDLKCQDNLFCNGSESCDPANGDPQTGCKPGALAWIGRGAFTPR